MAEIESKWALNMDKLAYGIAGVLGLVVLALPFVAGGQDQSSLLGHAEGVLKSAIATHAAKLQPKEYKNMEVEIARHWNAGTALAPNPDWSMERSPIFLQLIEKPLEVQATHEPCLILQLACERDPATKRSLVVIQGQPSPKNEYVNLRRVEVLRKEQGVEGDGKVLGSMDITKEPLEFRDETVEPGKVYSYALRSTVVRDPRQGDNVKFDPAMLVQVSEYVEIPAIPHEYSLIIQPFREQKFFGKLNYFDYKLNKVVEGRLEEHSESKRFAQNRFEFFLVDAAKQTVTVRDTSTRSKEDLTVSKEHRPVAAWPPVTPGGGAAAPGEETPPAEAAPSETKAAPPAPNAKAKAKAAPPAPAKAGGPPPKKKKIK